MRKVVLCLTALVLSASSGLAGQREAVMKMLRDHNRIGPAVPTGIDVDNTYAYKTDVSEQGYFRAYNHNDACLIHTAPTGLTYLCADHSRGNGSDPNGGH